MRVNTDIQAPVAQPAEQRLSSREARRLEQQRRLAAEVARQRRGRLRAVGAAVAGAVAFVALGYLYFTATPAARTAGRSADPRITLLAGQPAPDFVLPTTSGQPVSLAEYRAGRSVLLYFQEGVMCPPCWQQMRELRADQAKLDALDVALLTIAVDPPQMLAEMAARERVADMPLLYDEGARVSHQYQATYVSMHPGERPGHTFVLIDADGMIRWREDFREMYVPDARILGPVQQALRP